MMLKKNSTWAKKSKTLCASSTNKAIKLYSTDKKSTENSKKIQIKHTKSKSTLVRNKNTNFQENSKKHHLPPLSCRPLSQLEN